VQYAYCYRLAGVLVFHPQPLSGTQAPMRINTAVENILVRGTIGSCSS
jgi:hypothetical protein